MSLKSFIESAPISFQASAESLSSKASYTANGFVFAWGALTFNEILMLIATLVGVATFFVNWHFQRKRNHREREKAEREAELHRVTMQQAANRDAD